MKKSKVDSKVNSKVDYKKLLVLSLCREMQNKGYCWAGEDGLTKDEVGAVKEAWNEAKKMLDEEEKIMLKNIAKEDRFCTIKQK